MLRVNTRGHDGISTAATPQGGRRLGAAYEAVDDCRHDLAAWVDWLRPRAERIGLVGHSLGAVKGIYALARRPRPAVAALIALSPPRLSYSWFCESPQAAEFLADTAAPRASYSKGSRPPSSSSSCLCRSPSPRRATSRNIAPTSEYNYMKLIGAVPCPTLVTLGTVEAANNMAFKGAFEALQERAAKLPRVRSR